MSPLSCTTAKTLVVTPASGSGSWTKACLLAATFRDANPPRKKKMQAACIFKLLNIKNIDERKNPHESTCRTGMASPGTLEAATALATLPEVETPGNELRRLTVGTLNHEDAESTLSPSK